MNQIDDPFGYERGPEPEDAERLEKDLEIVRKQAEEMLDGLSENLRLPRDDILRLAVLVFGRYIDMTRSKDTLVLVVKGTVSPYENALEVLVSGESRGEDFQALFEHIEKAADPK
jgi:hypothetical protein